MLTGRKRVVFAVSAFVLVAAGLLVALNSDAQSDPAEEAQEASATTEFTTREASAITQVLDDSDVVIGPDYRVGVRAVADCYPNQLNRTTTEHLGLSKCWNLGFGGAGGTFYAGGALESDPSRGTLYAQWSPQVHEKQPPTEFVFEPGSGKVIIYHATGHAVCFTTNLGPQALDLDTWKITSIEAAECPPPSPVGAPVKGSCLALASEANVHPRTCWFMTLPNRERMSVHGADVQTWVGDAEDVVREVSAGWLGVGTPIDGPAEIPGVGTVDYTGVQGRFVDEANGAPPGVSGRPSIYYLHPLFLCFTTSSGAAAAYSFVELGPDGRPGRFLPVDEAPAPGCPPPSDY